MDGVREYSWSYVNATINVSITGFGNTVVGTDDRVVGSNKRVDLEPAPHLVYTTDGTPFPQSKSNRSTVEGHGDTILNGSRNQLLGYLKKYASRGDTSTSGSFSHFYSATAKCVLRLPLAAPLFFPLTTPLRSHDTIVNGSRNIMIASGYDAYSARCEPGAQCSVCPVSLR